MKKENIIKIMWISLGIDILYLIMLTVCIIFQSHLKVIVGCTEKMCEIFTIPYDIIITSLIRFIIHFAIIKISSSCLKKEDDSVVCEIAGTVISCGTLLPFHIIISSIIAAFTARMQGTLALASLSAMSTIINVINPLATISITLFVFSLGMSFCYKKIHSNGLK